MDKPLINRSQIIIVNTHHNPIFICTENHIYFYNPNQSIATFPKRII